MDNILLAPPLAFVIILLVSMGLSSVTEFLSAKGGEYYGKTKAYACGEDIPLHNARPEYGQFFPFAFFFTIMHVAALIIATVPSGMTGMSVLYLVTAILALFILFRR